MDKKWIWIGVAGAVVLGVGAYFLFQKKEDNKSDDHKDFKEIASKNGVNKNSIYGMDLASFSNDRQLVSKIAQELHDAMKYNGTDYTKIKNTLANLDELKFEIVYRRFGKRPYSISGEPAFEWMSSKQLSLKEWFEKELSDSQYKELKNKFPKLL